MVRGSSMKPGDLLRSRDKLKVGVVRIYTDDQCDSWETHMKKDELVVFLKEHQTQRGNVLTVLFPRGIRWLYRLDVEVIQ